MPIGCNGVFMRRHNRITEPTPIHPVGL